MWISLLYVLLFVILSAALIWATARVWRSRSKLARFGGGILLSLLTLVVVALTAVTARGAYVLYAPNPVEPYTVSVAGTPEQIARGEHLAESLCASCHSLTGELPLTGGFNLARDIGMPIGDLYPPNITPAGKVSGWTDDQIFTFFRTGHKPDGRWTIMPVVNFGNLSNEDLTAVIAFLRAQEPVESEVPPVQPSVLGLVLIGADMFKLPFEAKPTTITAPPVGPTVEYGEYIIGYQDCRDCHGQNFDGVLSGPFPAGPNLAAVKGWTAEQFTTTMRTGVTPAGHELQLPMPWKQIGKLDDTELTAIYEYLKAFNPQTAAEASN